MQTVLGIKGLKKSFDNYEGQKVSVLDIDYFNLQHQEQVGVEGLSGSGKTTFLNLIAGILQPDEGQIIFEGMDVALLSESRRDLWRAQNIGYVFQTFNLLQGYSALENVMLGMAFGKGVDPDFAETLLKRVNLTKHMHSKPRQMSIGQQQRVAVARALANKPKLVLADEPTGNLDHKHASETIALIQEVCIENKAALLLVSHDRGVLSKFEKIVKMSEINKVGEV
ncbi:MAG: ABC transporter ATP-binding protein [Candidatus Omnitrophota bacterium]